MSKIPEKLPERLRFEVQKHKDVNWDQVIQDAIEEKLKHLKGSNAPVFNNCQIVHWFNIRDWLD